MPQVGSRQGRGSEQGCWTKGSTVALLTGPGAKAAPERRKDHRLAGTGNLPSLSWPWSKPSFPGSLKVWPATQVPGRAGPHWPQAGVSHRMGSGDTWDRPLPSPWL